MLKNNRKKIITFVVFLTIIAILATTFGLFKLLDNKNPNEKVPNYYYIQPQGSEIIEDYRRTIISRDEVMYIVYDEDIEQMVIVEDYEVYIYYKDFNIETNQYEYELVGIVNFIQVKLKGRHFPMTFFRVNQLEKNFNFDEERVIVYE